VLNIPISRKQKVWMQRSKRKKAHPFRVHKNLEHLEINRESALPARAAAFPHTLQQQLFPLQQSFCTKKVSV